MIAAFLLAAPLIADVATTGNAGSETRSGVTVVSRPYAVLALQDGGHLMPMSPARWSGVHPFGGSFKLFNRTGSGFSAKGRADWWLESREGGAG
ncbi:MAG TPA: hypothetical protein VMF62_05685 [Acetobacteraceae bacterium]|nr:hypothetical protein [Acetobacteraceae bacterium]